MKTYSEENLYLEHSPFLLLSCPVLATLCFRMSLSSVYTITGALGTTGGGALGTTGEGTLGTTDGLVTTGFTDDDGTESRSLSPGPSMHMCL